MAQENLLDSIAELLSMQEVWMVKSEDGELHHLEEKIMGVPVLVTAKQEIYKLYFGKERAGINDFKRLIGIHEELISFVWENFAYKVKTDNQKELADIIEKYGLKKVKTREKKK
jgi:hypothetical protein